MKFILILVGRKLRRNLNYYLTYFGIKCKDYKRYKDMITIENVRKELLKFRVKHKFTQEKLAEKSGISRVTISSIESGKINKPDSMTIFKLDEFISNFNISSDL